MPGVKFHLSKDMLDIYAEKLPEIKGIVRTIVAKELDIPRDMVDLPIVIMLESDIEATKPQGVFYIEVEYSVPESWLVLRLAFKLLPKIVAKMCGITATDLKFINFSTADRKIMCTHVLEQINRFFMAIHQPTVWVKPVVGGAFVDGAYIVATPASENTGKIFIHSTFVNSILVKATAKLPVFYPPARGGPDAQNAYLPLTIEWICDKTTGQRAKLLVKLDHPEVNCGYDLIVNGDDPATAHIGLRPRTATASDLNAEILWARENIKPSDW